MKTSIIFLMFLLSSISATYSQEIYSTKNKDYQFDKVKSLILYISGDLDKLDKQDIKERLFKHIPKEVKILEVIYENPSMIDTEKNMIMKACSNHKTPFCLKVSKKKADLKFNPVLGVRYDYSFESVLLYGVTDSILWKCSGKQGAFDWIKRSIKLAIQDQIF